MTGSRAEASRLATEAVALLESIGDPTLIVSVSHSAMSTKFETGDVSQVLRLAQRVIDLAEGDPTMGSLTSRSPLATGMVMRGISRCCQGMPGWQDDLERGVAIARKLDVTSLAGVMWHRVLMIPFGMGLPDDQLMRDTAQVLEMAKQSGDDLALVLAMVERGIVLAYSFGTEHEGAWELFGEPLDVVRREGYVGMYPQPALYIAREMARRSDFDGAIDSARPVVEDLFARGGITWAVVATGILVEALLRRGHDVDIREAGAAVDRLSSVLTEPAFLVKDVWRLRMRAFLAQAHGDDTSYREYRDRYRAMATSLGFEGHMQWAEAMP